MTALNTSNAPAAVGPYAQARIAGNLVFVSGQLPIDPATGKIVEGGTPEQLRQCLANVSAIAATAGKDLSSVVKIVLLMTDLKDFAAVNKVYGETFAEPFPVRTTFQVAALPMGVSVEVEATIEL